MGFLKGVQPNNKVLLRRVRVCVHDTIAPSSNPSPPRLFHTTPVPLHMQICIHAYHLLISACKQTCVRSNARTRVLQFCWKMQTYIHAYLCSADGPTHTESNKLFRKVKHRYRPNISPRQRPTAKARLDQAALAASAEARGATHRARPRIHTHTVASMKRDRRKSLIHKYPHAIIHACTLTHAHVHCSLFGTCKPTYILTIHAYPHTYIDTL